MTKRAWAVIAVILLIPLLITLFCFVKWRSSNKVVADYGDSLDIIEYGSRTLHSCGAPEDYMAEPGTYLGKVYDSMLGTGLYTVKHDTSGSIWAVVSEKGTVLFTESGSLPSSAYGGDEITRVFFDSFTYELSEEYDISVISGIINTASSAVLYTPSDEVKCVSRTIHLCFDGCAVSTVTPGEILYFPDSGKWFYLASAEKERAAEAYASGDSDALEYEAQEISSGKAVRLLKSLFLGSQTTSSAQSSDGISG